MAAGRILAISGGVGGAKLALGLARSLPADELLVVANTGDDFDHLGFRICPDLDTVMYTLAGIANMDVGWGQAGETWHFLDALERLGGETWFRLGDRDLATHVQRTRALARGQTLSAVTATLCQQLGIAVPVVPMTDDAVPTVVTTAGGERLAFQHYFVRDRCEPVVAGFEFVGVSKAAPAPAFRAALEDPELAAIIICPSNPFVSVDPVLAVPGVQAAMAAGTAPVVAVSPIIGGQAIKGPAAKMMRELGIPRSSEAVARHYEGRIDALVIDAVDAAEAAAIEAMGIRVLVTETLMRSLDDRERLAREVLAFAHEIAR